MQENWLIGFADGQYIVYERSEDCCGGDAVGRELARNFYLDAAFQDARNFELNEEADREIAAVEYAAKLAAMTPEQRAKHDLKVSRQMYSASLVERLLPVLPMIGDR